MSELIRFGVSIEKELSNSFDKKISRQGYKNRSEAIRDLIRHSLVEDNWNDNEIVAGGISILYDHHRRDLLNKIVDLQHNYHELIISTQHVHLSHNGCLEIIVAKGRAENIRELYEKLKSVKGISHVGITRTGIPSRII